MSHAQESAAKWPAAATAVAEAAVAVELKFVDVN